MSLFQIAEPGESRVKEACRGRVVGIDLGTTNSLVAVVTDGTPRCLLDPQGQALLPSVVRYQAGSPPVVGRAAKSSECSSVCRSRHHSRRAVPGKPSSAT